MSCTGHAKGSILRLSLFLRHRMLHLNMPDPFATLPAPLPLIIMEAIEDLPTLHNLLLASSASSYYFEQYYVEVTEAILTNYVPEMRQLLRSMIIVRSNASCRQHNLATPKYLKNFLMSYLIRPSLWADSTLSKETMSSQAIRSHITSAPVIRLASRWCFRSLSEEAEAELPS